MFFVRDMSNKELTQEKLMAEYSSITAKERLQVRMASVRIINQQRPNANQNSNSLKTNTNSEHHQDVNNRSDKKWCGKCQKEVQAKANHCKDYEKCHKPEVCQSKNLELTPEFQRKKKAQSTTAATSQNSGVGVLSTTSSNGIGVSGLTWSGNFPSINSDFYISPQYQTALLVLVLKSNRLLRQEY